MQITKVNCPTNKYAYKCPYYMTPKYITIHNTANDASAMSEISYMLNNWNYTSYHFAVDDYRAVQGLPLNRNGWHAGDGANGTGNRYTIGVEICYSKSGGTRFDKAERNAAKLTAMLLKQYGWGIDRVKKHQDWSGKYCPHRTLDRGWQRFLNMVKAEMGGKTNTTTSKPTSTGKSIDAVAREVINGKWGNGADRRRNLEKSGYNYNTVQARVDEILLGKPSTSKSTGKSIDTLAKEVINGKWGNGSARKNNLEKAGYNYNSVQAKVDEILLGKSATKKSTKSIDTLAREVIRGDWGNGADRRKNLERAGYNYNAVQARVNQLLK